MWHDLALPQFTTFSRSRGSAERSVLERYDHEHRFRLKVAEVAARRTGAPDDPEPIVVPIAQDECLTCPYRDWCAEQMGPDDPSAAITTGRLRIREWLSLQALGVTTTAALAEVDLDDEELMAAFLAEHTHDRAGAARRLAEAVRRAGMVRDGVRLLRTGDGPARGPTRRRRDRPRLRVRPRQPQVPVGRPHLAPATPPPVPGGRPGTAPSSPGSPSTPRGRPRSPPSWSRGCAPRSRRRRPRARTLQVHHWTAVEPDALRSILGADAVADVLAHFVDLYDVVRAQFVGAFGLGLKAVAPAFGFALARRRRRRLAVADLAAGRARHRLARPRGDAAAGARVQRGRRRGDGGRAGGSHPAGRAGGRDRRVGSWQRRPTEHEGWGSRWVSRWPRAATSR